MRKLTVSADVELVRQLGNRHVETVLDTIQGFRVGLVRNERDRQSFGTETTSARNLQTEWDL